MANNADHISKWSLYCKCQKRIAQYSLQNQGELAEAEAKFFIHKLICEEFLEKAS